ncbi:caspase-7-like isoform X2 [Hydractinia symbiolongicarpus]|nr:caspase-7-like isoform X2 [Hydractinia symbiolongicarpus]
MPTFGPSVWTKFLKDVADHLTTSDVKCIKFLSAEHIPMGKAENLSDASDLLKMLETLGLISCNDITHLYELVEAIPRKDLIKKLDAYEAHRLSMEKTSEKGGKEQYEDDDIRSKSFSSESELRSKNKPEVNRTKSTSSLLTPDNIRKRANQSHLKVKRNSNEDVTNTSSNRLPGGSRPPEYSMKSIPRGKCLIFSNSFENGVKLYTGAVLKERKGTEHDVSNLKKTFEWLGFEVTVYPDHTASEMSEVLEHVAAKEDHENYDCFVCCILSHGFDGGVYGNDGRKVKLADIKTIFEGNNCPKLFQKPKLFFIQACQGENDGKGVSIESDSPMAPQQNAQVSQEIVRVRLHKEIPSNADFLIFMATSSGTISWRNPKTGSWFIQCLCDVFQKRAMTWSLSQMLLEVNNKIAEKEDKTPEGEVAKQMSDAGRNTMRMELYFYPRNIFSASLDQNKQGLQHDAHQKEPVECEDAL